MRISDYVPFFVQQLRLKKRIQKRYGKGNIIHTYKIGKNVTLGNEREGYICLRMLN
jgi:hypothetical protein